MRKILLIVFLFFLCAEVSAKSYYSEYGEYSDYQETEVVSNDTKKVEAITKYQLYSEEETLEYLLDYDGDATGNVKEVETSWVEDYNLIDDSKPIEECYVREERNIKDFKHLYIDNQSEFSIVLKKFKLMTLDGEVISESENIKFFDYTVLNLEIEKYNYTFDEVKLETYFEKEDPTQTGELSVGYYLRITDDHTNLDYKIKDFTTSSNSIIANIDDFSNYSQYSDTCSSYKPTNGKNYKTYYRNKYILKEYKVIKKNYIDEYEVIARDPYQIDKEKSKKFYRYKTRDKVEIKDELLIDNHDIKLTDFILNSTIPIDEIKIVSNVNYFKNGDYKIKFILPFTMIEKNIKVNVEKNLVDTINKQNEYINELKISNEKNSYAVDKKNQEIKSLIIEEENKINNTLKELDSCYKNVSSLKNAKQQFKIVEEKTNHHKILVLVLIGLIITMIVIKKNIRKKNI